MRRFGRWLRRLATLRWPWPRPPKALPAPGEFAELARALATRVPIFGHEVRPSGDVVLSGRNETGQFRLVFCPAAPLVHRVAETLVEVEPDGPRLPTSFCLFPRTFAGGTESSEHAVRTGDRLFDRRWIIEGEARAILATMDTETRASIERCGRLTVGSGWLYMLVDGLNVEVEGAAAQVQHALLLAERLARGLGAAVTSERLMANLVSETNGQVRLALTEALLDDADDPATLSRVFAYWFAAFSGERRTRVRLRVLELMVERVGSDDRTTSLLDRALLDASPDVRLFAARHRGEQGLPVMKHVASTRFAGEDTRIDALFLLGQRLLDHEFREILVLCAKEAAPRVRRYALKRLLDDPQAQLTDELVRVAKGSDREAAEELAENLARVPGPVSEPALLSLLANRNSRVKRAAAISLGAVGTVASVPPLLALASPIIFDGSLRDVARIAVLKIQYRIQNGEVGGLSLVEGGEHVGALSKADDELGGLSLDQSEGGGLDARPPST